MPKASELICLISYFSTLKAKTQMIVTKILESVQIWTLMMMALIIAVLAKVVLRTCTETEPSAEKLMNARRQLILIIVANLQYVQIRYFHLNAAVFLALSMAQVLV